MSQKFTPVKTKFNFKPEAFSGYFSISYKTLILCWFLHLIQSTKNVTKQFYELKFLCIAKF